MRCFLSQTTISYVGSAPVIANRLQPSLEDPNLFNSSNKLQATLEVKEGNPELQGQLVRLDVIDDVAHRTFTIDNDRERTYLCCIRASCNSKCCLLWACVVVVFTAVVVGVQSISVSGNR